MDHWEQQPGVLTRLDYERMLVETDPGHRLGRVPSALLDFFRPTLGITVSILASFVSLVGIAFPLSRILSMALPMMKLMTDKTKLFSAQ